MSWTCPKCERELLNERQTHYCAKVSLDSLFAGKPDELILIFDKLLAEVSDWEGVLIGTTPNCIVFTHRRTFLVIRPMKKELDIQFYSTEHHPEKPFVKSVIYNRKYENHIRINRLDDLRPQLFAYIYESYRLL